MAVSEKKKDRIRDRQKQKAARAHAAELAALRSGKHSARHDFHQEVKSARGAAAYLNNALSDAIAAARDSGLRGRYLHQTIAELKAQQADTSQIVPMARQAAKSELQDTLSSLNDQLLTERLQKQSDAREGIQAALKRARQHEREQAQRKRENRKKRTSMVKNTKIAMLNSLDATHQIATTPLPAPADDASQSDKDQYAKDLATKQNAIQFLNDLRTGKEKAVRALATDVAGADGGGDLFEALAMVRRLLDSRAVGKRTNPFNVYPMG